LDFLNLTVIGWLFAVGCGLAIVLGAWIIMNLHRAGEGERKHLAARVLDDSLLFGIWILGLAGGVGVLLEKSWSRWALELFCWTLMVLTFLSAYNRWRATPPPRGMLLISLILFLFPLIALSVATILTLRGEAALRILVG